MTRRESREAALCLLFEHGFSPEEAPEEIMERAKEMREEKYSAFAKSLFEGACAHEKEIDVRISAAADNWSMSRISRVSLAVLRLASFELLFGEGTDTEIIVNEAIELARRYDDDKAPAFVNGVLGRIAADRNG